MDPLVKLLAASDNFDVVRIEGFVFDFNRSVLVVVGTPHLGNGCRIIPFDPFNRRIESRAQSNPPPNSAPITGTRHAGETYVLSGNNHNGVNTP